MSAVSSETELVHAALTFKIRPFCGVFTKDHELTRLHDGAYIFNLQDNMDSGGQLNPGTHWVCMWVEHHKFVLYFDPFGLPPPANIEALLDGYQVWYNDLQVQSVDTGYCGWYCISFLKYMCSHMWFRPEERLDRFLKLWSHNPKENLSRLKSMMHLK